MRYVFSFVILLLTTFSLAADKPNIVLIVGDDMHLMTTPHEPKANPVLLQKLANPKYASWRTFLPHLVVGALATAGDAI